ncbi:MAG TPA: RNA-binding protein [Acidimicrobiaceae bacterium]|nr:RNA-binding protein [Acidimicrobiaceae bacterium]HCB36806.1 RNA-binding protein [Acidimicrobiaceae bacterium]
MTEVEQGTAAEEVLIYLISHLVEHTDQVEVEITETDSKLTMLAKVSPDDIGRVIGKRGRVANAIRALVVAAGKKDGIDVEVEFDG